jgi:hypothetical protein
MKGYENMEQTMAREQTITQRLKNPKIYDGKKLWKAYHSWGKAATNEKLKEYAYSVGMYDSEKGRPSNSGPRTAMWLYAFENPLEAYPSWVEWVKQYDNRMAEGHIQVNFKEFIKEIDRVSRGIQMKTPRRIDAWRKRWDEYIKEHPEK